MNTLANRRILLLGGAGFIGHNLALELKAAGANVVVIDSLQINNIRSIESNPNAFHDPVLYSRILQERLDLLNAAGIPLIIQDIRDYHALSAIYNEREPQVVIHLAAIAHAGKANKDPFSTFDHNLRTLENALDATRCPFFEHFIYFSSSMVYGDFLTDKVTEESPCNPLGIYGALKYAGEKIVIAYQQVFGTPYTIVRPSALYGRRCVSRRIGQIFIENALKGHEVTVQGDGGERLDFTHIDDLVQGVRCVIERPESRNEIFNLTFGESRSINDMAALLLMEFPDVRIVHENRDALMPKRGTLDISKARRRLGYEPCYPLEKGFPEYIDWYRGLFAE